MSATCLPENVKRSRPRASSKLQTPTVPHSFRVLGEMSGVRYLVFFQTTSSLFRRSIMASTLPLSARRNKRRPSAPLRKKMSPDSGTSSSSGLPSRCAYNLPSRTEIGLRHSGRQLVSPGVLAIFLHVRPFPARGLRSSGTFARPQSAIFRCDTSRYRCRDSGRSGPDRRSSRFHSGRRRGLPYHPGCCFWIHDFDAAGIARRKRSHIFDESGFIHASSLLVEVHAVVGEIFLPGCLVARSHAIEHLLRVTDEIALRDRSLLARHAGGRHHPNQQQIVDRIIMPSIRLKSVSQGSSKF